MSIRADFKDLRKAILTRLPAAPTLREVALDVVNRRGGDWSSYTAGDLLAVVRAGLAPHPPPPRRSRRKTFYRLRKVLVDAYGLSPRQVRPSAELDSIIPVEGRPIRWCKVQDAFDGVPPDLYLREDVGAGGCLLSLILLGWLMILGIMGRPIGMALAHRPALRIALTVAAVVVALGLIVATYLALRRPTRPTRYTFPKRLRTVRNLVVMLVHAGAGETVPGDWADDVVWDELRPALAATFDVDEDSVIPETRLIPDLGLTAPRCAACGYDLRATAERCPECGAVIL